MTNLIKFISTMKNIKPLTSWSFSEIMIVWNHNKELKIKDIEDIAYLKYCEKKDICPESGQPLYPVTFHYPTSTNPNGWTEKRCTDASCRCDQTY